MIVKAGRYSIKFEKGPTMAYLCLLPLLLALGVWQLGRSDEKRHFLEQQEQSLASAEILRLSAGTEDDVERLRYNKVIATGHYDQAHQFLIDNQISAGKAGYFVLTPFVLQGQTKAVLVNRGWVPLNQDRSVLPDVQISNEQTVITGRINRFPSVGIKLAGAEIPAEHWPSVTQVVDTAVLAKKLAYPLFSFQIELDKNLPEGFKREWQTTTVMLPEQHTAYAMQWFALAITLTILFIGYSCKKNDN